MQRWRSGMHLATVVALGYLVLARRATTQQSAAPVEKPAEMPAPQNHSWFNTGWLVEKLVAPAVLVALTAWLGSYFIPSITRQWQDHQKEIELKNALVSQMSDAGTRMAFTTQLLEFRFRPNQDLSSFDAEYRDWSISSQVILAKLRSYFTSPDIATNWGIYSDLVTLLYATADCGGSQRRSRLIAMRQDITALEKLDQGFVDSRGIRSLTANQWNLLENNCSLPLGKNSDLARTWQALHDAVVTLQSLPVEAVLRESITTF